MNERFDETMKSRPKLNTGNEETFSPGQVVAGKFKIVSRLGAGGMGTVYRVENIFLQREFALKTMENRTGSEVLIQRFQLEAKAAFSLNHPNLVKVHDFGILDNDNPYLVMDFINGITFAEYLKLHGPLPIEHVTPLFAQACFGLMAAHEQSVVHRDIKPANLMLLNDVPIDSEGSVKIVDFGIAKLVNREDGEIQALTRTGEIFGSPLYMSPEQCSSGTVDHRSDIYSLGCVLFEMLTGTPPHMGQSALKTMLLHQAGDLPTLKEASLGRDFPEELERIVAKMLRKYPEQRYQNIGLVAQDLTMFGSENRSTSKVKAQRIVQKSEIAPPKAISITSTRLYTLLALTGAFAAILAGAVVYFINDGRTKSLSAMQTISSAPIESEIVKGATTGSLFPSPEEQNSVAMSETEEKAKLLEKLEPIQELDITTDQGKQHVYKFPEIKLGELCISKSPEFGEYTKHAQGTVSVPADKLNGIQISGYEAIAMLRAPSIFKKIPGKDFHSLVLGKPMDVGSAMAAEEQSSPEIEKNIAQALQNLDGWTNLEAIHIKFFSLNEDALKALNNFKKLRILTLDDCSLKAEILAKQPFLSKLTICYMQNCTVDNNPIINKLGSSSALQNLVIDGKISAESLGKLQGCPNLNLLTIGTRRSDDKTKTTIDDAAIAKICGMKKLAGVKLVHMKLSNKQIEMLTKCAWLKEISLSRSAYKEEAEIVRALDPRIDFVEDR